MKHFILIIFSFPVVLLSQNERIVFIEVGTSVNQSFYPKENLTQTSFGWCGTGGPVPNGFYNEKIQRLTTFSFYSKLGIEATLRKRKHFSISCPFIFGYRERREIYKTESEQVPYNSSPYKYSENTQYYTRFFSLIFGPKATMNFNKWSYFTSINLNTDLFLFGRTTLVFKSDFDSYKNEFEGSGNYNSEDILFNLSLQNGILYKINPKIAIGITNDLFFYNINPEVIKSDKKDNHLFNFGYGTNSTIINTGVRLQYSF